MPTWPSASKASTTNVDQGTDQISLARADIKQNMDNVNDIIDIFNIASPTNGDIMQYNSSTTKWEKVASTAVGSTVKVAEITISTNENVGGVRRYLLSTSSGLTDPDSIITLSDSNYRFTLAAGTYQISFRQIQGTVDTGTNYTFYFYNYTDSTSTDTPFINVSRADVSPSFISVQNSILKISATKTWEYRSDHSQGNRAATGMYIVKLK